uniref:Protein kinase domain-containing protein n=1 Tax=Lotharella globosa TaxID=91324 RepID=A0A7S4DNF8_9EUKA|mmetsp:Transcript_14013/g.26546  ORF Transcript_14013/g.26546 Transcript_14013/m.26546 type:complete len:430 (-) Transcript_14013:492-1781(-)
MINNNVVMNNHPNNYGASAGAGPGTPSHRQHLAPRPHFHMEEHKGEEGEGEAAESSFAKQGWLFKLGAKTGRFRRRWCKVQDNFFYEFKNANAKVPSRVVFLEGYFFAEGKINKPGYYAIEMARKDAMRWYFVKSDKERKEWVSALQTAGKSVPIERYYDIGSAIGKGRFSTVYSARHIPSKTVVAVKVIEKKRMRANEREREALRTEIAVLRLVRHPNIIHMREIFESSKTIYIVMEWMKAGDLFERIISRKVLPEFTVKSIIFQLLSAVSYLHRRGIAHRDLKPENVLCTSIDDDTKVIIADFGLSKFARPTEMMKMPCGTLAYVAPEVLSHKGYSKGVDVWSLGVIFYLLLRGGLPFDGKSKADVVHRTLTAQVSFRHPRWKYVSPMACNLILKLLVKDPKSRISVDDALKDKWFDSVRSRLGVHR